MEHSLKKLNIRSSEEIVEESKRTGVLDADELLESLLHEELAKIDHEYKWTKKTESE
jgi:hypothetical protein